MAFSLRKMLSNINYFKKLDDDDTLVQNENLTKKRRHTFSETSLEQPNTDFEHLEIEADSTSVPTDQIEVENIKIESEQDSNEKIEGPENSPPKPNTNRNKKLKLEVNKLPTDDIESLSKDIGEPNTPKLVSLGLNSTDRFAERIKQFDLSKSFDLFDVISDEGQLDDNVDGLSLHSDTDTSICSEVNNKTSIKMCRKVDPVNTNLVRSITPESFADVEFERNDDERLAVLQSYQSKLEKFDYVLKSTLSEFQFHIEISKIFYRKSIVPSKQGLAQLLESETNRVETPTNWDFILEQEDLVSKIQLKNQLIDMKEYIDNFISQYLKTESEQTKKSIIPSITFHEVKKRKRVSKKKSKRRLNDFPDFNEALHKLFSLDSDSGNCAADTASCICNCHQPPISESSVKDDTTYSISSSIGNFTLDSSTLTVYSETLDNIISFSSFEDSSLYTSITSKASVERLTFYVQVHNIQLQSDCEIDGKSPLKFDCLTCSFETDDECVILKHVLEKSHCEKLHFLYKSSYIKKCLSSGKEIQPSTVLNPMTMYRDLNKIVCFGDAMYACSLCFESLIVGESVLMAHCSEENHVAKKRMLDEFLG